VSDDLEPLPPQRESRRGWTTSGSDRVDSTVQSYGYRLAPFIEWCARDDIDDLNDLSSRDVFRYEAVRRGEDVKDSAPDEGVRTEFESRLGSCLLAAADVVQRAVQLEEFADNVAVSNPVPARGRVRDLLDKFDLDQEVGVVADSLARDASVVCEFGFVELTVRRKVKQRVYEDWDGVVLREIEPSAGMLLSEFLLLSAVGHVLRTAHTEKQRGCVYKSFHYC